MKLFAEIVPKGDVVSYHPNVELLGSPLESRQEIRDIPCAKACTAGLPCFCVC